jgi:hypothetical protein
VIRNTTFYELLNKNELNIPTPSQLPHSDKTVPYVFIGDEAFQLLDNLMKPYSQSVLNTERRIYNYRHSRARRIVENCFGILTSRFGIFQKPINLSPQKANVVVLACCYLHNFLKKISSRYANLGEIDTEDTTLNILHSDCVVPLRTNTAASTNTAKQIRDTYCSYFNNEGKVEWQENCA